MQLEDELKQWGPEALGKGGESPTLEFSQQYCRRLARSHYENFVVVGVFTPPRLRIAFEAVYGFCRWADDLGDETGSPEKSGQLLGWWQQQLEEVYRPGAPEPRHPVYVALKPVINQFQLPIKPFSDLISAFMQDQWKTRFTDHAELLDYCTRSANPVGELVLRLFDEASEKNLVMSNDICTGLQLANFWQDVSRDLVKGRIYIPQKSMEKHGVTERDLARVSATEAFRQMLAEEVEKTRDLFESGRGLPEKLHGRVGLALRLFHAGGVATLDAIEKSGFDVLTRRPRVGKMTQLMLMARILAGSLLPGASSRTRR